MGKAFFVTGTDTGVGKTFATCALMRAAQNKGLSTMGLKPVAAGCEWIDDQWQNEDARLLNQHMTVELAYNQINPVALKAATSPHIAANEEDRNVTAARIVGYCRGALMQRPDLALIEGAGGWYVPINNRETLADVARELQLPVIVVVSLRLGCLNHAMLTIKAVQTAGLKVAGWIGNRTDVVPMDYEVEYIASLRSAIASPCLGILPFVESGNPEIAATHLAIDCLEL